MLLSIATVNVYGHCLLGSLYVFFVTWSSVCEGLVTDKLAIFTPYFNRKQHLEL